MKSPMWKLRKLGLNKSEPEENLNRLISVHEDGLTQAAKDMKDMRTCYDGLLLAAAATANSAYEFSESLLEMGNCLLEKTAMHDDGESGEALTLLGRVQLELQKFVNSYRSHILMTITHPSESLLSELRKVEEMKLQCDEKRDTFEYMVGQFKEKRKPRHGKEETFTSEQLQAVSEEYDEAARLCVFRMESLKQGQCRSLLTQAARHHAAQLNFFRKGLQSLEAVEPHIRNVAEKQHIDYEICEGNDEANIYKTNEDVDSSFDYSRNEKELANTITSKNSMEMNSVKNHGDDVIVSQRSRAAVSHSAPLYTEMFDSVKTNRHVLPIPHDDSKGSSITSSISTTGVGGSSKNLWHSSPPDIEEKQRKFIDEEKSRNNKHFLPLPLPPRPPLTDRQSGFDARKLKKTQSFSGPLVSSKPSSCIDDVSSGLNFHVSSPKISELHELPKPPLVNRNNQQTNRNLSTPLPLPHLTVSRSFSIPSTNLRSTPFHSGKLLESSETVHKIEKVNEF